jgi:DNA-binding PucR family transcriptional regulator
MDIVVHLGATAIDRAYRHNAQLAAAEELRRGLVTQGSLLKEVLAGGSTTSLAATLTDLLQAPVLILDFFAGNLEATRSPIPETCDDKAWRKALEGRAGRQILQEMRTAISGGFGTSVSLHLRDLSKQPLHAQVEPLLVDGDAVGALASFGRGSMSDLQRLMFESAKFALSVQMMRSVIRFRSETRTLTELFSEIIERRWRDADDVIGRARRLGIALTTPTRMLLVDFPDRPRHAHDLSADSRHAVERLARQSNITVHVVTASGGLICLVPQADAAPAGKVDQLTKRIAETLRHTFDCEPIVVQGGTCDALEHYPKEWERCWRMIRIARAFGRRGALAAPEFGPLPMLVGAADSADVRSFVESSIGPLVAHDRANDTPYLETLAAYVRSGCRSQPCADAMGLHVTTLRYRLSRIATLFGIEVDTPERRFAIELALQLNDLIGSHPVTP